MIDLQTLPADEAERIAYAEGFTGTAALFARIAELEAQVESLENVLDTVMEMDVKGHQLQDRLQFSVSGREILTQYRTVRGLE